MDKASESANEATKNAAATGNDSLRPEIRAAGAALQARDVERRPGFWKRLHATGVNVIRQNFYAEGSLGRRHRELVRVRRGPVVRRCRGIDPGLVEESPSRWSRSRRSRFPREAPADGPARYCWNNPAFSYSDAMAYYCAIRKFRAAAHPRGRQRIFDPGRRCGLRANGSGELVLFEPFPKDFLHGLETVSRIRHALLAADPGGEYLDLLNDGCLWFIDSTHTVKPGGDCLYLYLKVMPRVKRRVLTHSHDIYRAFPFPKSKFYKRRVGWTEQLPALRLPAQQSPRTGGVREQLPAPYQQTLLERLMDGRAAPEAARSGTG